MQAGTCDCGLYAIAYATTIANGDDPCHIVYDQSKMRRHLFQCFLEGKLTPFPCRQGLLSKTRVKTSDDIEVFCHCRMPELKTTPMIQCTKCENWFHCACEDVPKAAIDNTSTEWFCKTCSR